MVTAYAFMATVVILVMPLVTEIYELRKFMLERASVEPGLPDQVDPPHSPNLPDEDAAAAGDHVSPLKAMKHATNGDQFDQRSADEIRHTDDGNATQTDVV